MQVEPMKPLLKAPGTTLLKLRYDEPDANVTFKFNLRRYSVVARPENMNGGGVTACAWSLNGARLATAAWNGTVRGTAMQVDAIKPNFNAPATKRLKLKYNKLLSKFSFKFNLRRYNECG